MLGDFLLLVGATGSRSGVGGGDLVLDGTVGSCASGQFSTADVFIHPAIQVVCLTDVDDITLIVADAVFASACRGLVP